MRDNETRNKRASQVIADYSGILKDTKEEFVSQYLWFNHIATKTNNTDRWLTQSTNMKVCLT